MSIKIGTKIEKLHPTDSYKLMDWDDINDTHNLKDSIDNLKQGQATLENNINQKPDGFHLEDTDGNAYDDITGLVFEGAEVQDDQGTKTCHVVVKPKITVANGQEPGSTSEAGNALIFDGATITVDPNDNNVVHVTIGSATNTFKLSDGVGIAKDVHELHLEGADIRSSDGIANIHIPFKHFATLAERDAWSTKYATAVKHDVIAVVDADENGFVQWYKYTSSTRVWSEYNASGVVMSDSSGAIPRNIKTIVFGSGFSIQQAGDQEDAALVTYAGGSTGGSPLEVSEQWGDYSTVSDVTELHTLFPLEVNQGKSGPSQPVPGVAMLSIKPGTYEGAHSPAFLGKVGSLTEIKDGHDTVVYYNSPITPYGMYFSSNDILQGLNIQEDDNKDPNLGGQLTELLISIGFEGGAPSRGTVKLWLMYHQQGQFIPDGYLTDVNDKPFIIEKSFAVGEEIKLILDGAYYAQGQETITVHIEHDFKDEYLIVDPEESLFCVNQYQYDTGSSLARVEFLRRNETQITPAFFNFDSNFVSMSSFMYGVNKPETEADIGEGENFIAQFGITNLTKIKASITNGVFSISDNGTDIADFYVDYLVDNVRTQMMRGKTFTVAFRGNSPDSAFEMALYTWNGKADEPAKIYSSRNNSVINVNTGWREVEKVFITEDPSGGPKNTSAEFVIPEDAVNVAFALIPIASQQPLTLTVEDFAIAPKKPFIGYVAIEKHDLRTVHLDTRDDYLELGQNSEGFASLRYTLNYSPISGLPMPVGVPLKGKAPFTLDKSKNVISGSSATGGEGALVAGQSGQVSLSCDYLLWNEQNTASVVTLWWVLYDVDGNDSKIANSEIEFTIPKNTTTHGINKTQPAFVFEIEKGQAVALRASANKNDGAFLESTKLTDYMVRPIIDFKELVPGVSDDSDLISAPLDKKLVVDRRVHPFTGNQSQNVVIADLDIPSDVVLANVTAEKELPNGFTSIESVQHAYNKQTNELTVHVGSVNQGILFLEFWG